MAVYQEKDKSKWTKDGRHWYFIVYYKDSRGKLKQKWSKMYASRKEATDEESVFILKRDVPYNKPFHLVWTDYINHLSKTKKASTVNSYKKDYNNHIKPFFDKMNISSIGVKNVREWAENIEKSGISVAYANKIHSILNKIFDYAIKNYDLPDNPSRTFGAFQKKNDKVISDKEKLRYITYDEFQKFSKVIDNSMWKTFFTFAYYTGCRRGEIIALKWNDIDFVNNEIIINKTLYEEVKGQIHVTSTKNNLNRKIKMNKTLKACLEEYKKEVQQYIDFNNNWYVFGNTRFLPKTTIARYKHKYFKDSNVHEITMHEFRHSHVSLLINEFVKSSREKNMKVDTAKFFLMMSNRMGHTIQVMQDTYMHLFPTIQDEIVDLLNNL